jgi:hypothetical protein
MSETLSDPILIPISLIWYLPRDSIINVANYHVLRKRLKNLACKFEMYKKTNEDDLTYINWNYKTIFQFNFTYLFIFLTSLKCLIVLRQKFKLTIFINLGQVTQVSTKSNYKLDPDSWKQIKMA